MELSQKLRYRKIEMSNHKCLINLCDAKPYKDGYCITHYQKYVVTGNEIEMKICKIDNCFNKVYSLLYCQRHYRRFKKHGDPLYIKPVRGCDSPGCNEKHFADGYCQRHYRRWKNHEKNDNKYTSSGIICRIRHCNNDAFLFGLCLEHYTQEKSGETIPDRPCRVPGCLESRIADGLCIGHYNDYAGNTDKLLERPDFSPLKIGWIKNYPGSISSPKIRIALLDYAFVHHNKRYKEYWKGRFEKSNGNIVRHPEGKISQFTGNKILKILIDLISRDLHISRSEFINMVMKEIANG